MYIHAVNDVALNGDSGCARENRRTPATTRSPWLISGIRGTRSVTCVSRRVDPELTYCPTTVELHETPLYLNVNNARHSLSPVSLPPDRIWIPIRRVERFMCKMCVYRVCKSHSIGLVHTPRKKENQKVQKEAKSSREWARIIVSYYITDFPRCVPLDIAFY